MTEKKKNKTSEFVFTIIIFIGIISYTLIKNEDKLSRLLNLINDKHFMLSIAFIVLWSVYWLFINSSTDSRYKKATKQAILGLIIALFAYLELTIAPFWFVWISAFFLNI